jgi:hypothetical protein
MKIFISHANEKLAGRVAQALKQAGFEVWDAEREILPGDNWYEKMAQALEESEAMVVLLTPESSRSPWMRKEIEYALGNEAFKQRLIPVIVGSPDTFPVENIPWILRRMKTIYCLNRIRRKKVSNRLLRR